MDDCPLLRDELIVYYSLRNVPVSDMQCILQRIHGYSISKTQLIRLRKKFGVGRNRSESSMSDIFGAIQREIGTSGSLFGYRAMWTRLNQTYGLSVRRDTTMMMLSLMDPVGTERRKKRRLLRRIYRSKGPNFIWHADGYDKLKPYGITIHAALDGYSRRIMWAKTAYSNNNPNMIAQYYLDTVETIGGCPSILRTDRGTENSVVAFLQPTLRHAHHDSFAGDQSFQYGRSTANQRIEAWWSYLRLHMSGWWIDYFKDMQLNGHLDNTVKHNIDTVRYCFGPVIEKELSQIVIEWNNHRIRKSTTAEAPGGIPNVLYFLPETSGAQDLKCQPARDLLQDANDMFGYTGNTLVDKTFKDFADSVCTEYELHYPPESHEDGLYMYFIIKDECENFSM